MNPDTMRVVRLPVPSVDSNGLPDRDEVERLLTEPFNFEVLPAALDMAAQAFLHGRPEATVSRTSGGKLSRWAAKRRKEKRKAAAAARRMNRK